MRDEASLPEQSEEILSSGGKIKVEMFQAINEIGNKGHILPGHRPANYILITAPSLASDIMSKWEAYSKWILSSRS